MPVVLLIAIIAVLVGVFFAATGRGGEMSYEPADHAPLDLGPLSAADVALLRPPTAMLGYNTQVTDEALEHVARAMRERDVKIAYLEQQLAILDPQGFGAQPGRAHALADPGGHLSEAAPLPRSLPAAAGLGGPEDPTLPDDIWLPGPSPASDDVREPDLIPFPDDSRAPESLTVAEDEAPGGPETWPVAGDEAPGGPEARPVAGDEVPRAPESLTGAGDEVPGEPEARPGAEDEVPGVAEARPGAGITEASDEPEIIRVVVPRGTLQPSEALLPEDSPQPHGSSLPQESPQLQKSLQTQESLQTQKFSDTLEVPQILQAPQTPLVLKAPAPPGPSGDQAPTEPSAAHEAARPSEVRDPGQPLAVAPAEEPENEATQPSGIYDAGPQGSYNTHDWWAEQKQAAREEALRKAAGREADETRAGERDR